MRARVCDRCGEVLAFKRDSGPVPKVYVVQTGIREWGTDFIKTDKDSKNYDLCEKCHDELASWINGDKQ